MSTKDKKSETVQIRISKKLHKQLKHYATELEQTMTFTATQMILYCLVNELNFDDEIRTIEF